MIRAERLTKHFGATIAVEDLSFDVTPGIVTGFLGPNGAGKTTTMRMILGLDRPTQGKVTVNGRNYADIGAPMQEIGSVLDASAVQGNRSAYNHLRWLARAARIPERRVDEVLDTVGLTDVAGRRVGGFSLGMRQRLGIAVALLGDPEILLFDEPVNGLDPEGIYWIRSLMKRFAAEGRTVLVSSHLMNEMEETADHVLVIGRGKLIADMNIAEFMQRSSRSHVRVIAPDIAPLVPELENRGARVRHLEPGAATDGKHGLIVTGTDAATIGALALRHGVELHELAPRRASLEEAFMELTRDSLDYRATANGGAEPDVIELTTT